MFENICTLPLTSELFSQALHPTLPILSVGLSAGHVHTYKLPDPVTSSISPSPDPQQSSEENIISYDGVPRRSSLRRTSTASAASDSGFGVVDTAWRTRRHKGSCRALAYSLDGDILFSAGTDGLVKAARSEDGRVISKIAIPCEDNGALDPPTSLNILNPQNLVISTDSSAVYFYDLRADPSPTISFKPTSTHHPHSSFLSSLTPLPPSEASTSSVARQFVSTGGTTLAVTDIRRGVLVRSEDQEEELTASIYVSGLHKGGTSKGEKAVVGDASGVLTLWERGVWDDQDERIIVDRSGESLGIESLAQVPDHATSRTGPQGEHKLVATGLGDGKIKFVRLGANKVLSDWDLQHDEIEGVTALSFDVGGRLISGGGSTVKIWREAMTKIVATPGFLNGSKRSAEADSDDDDDDADAVNDSDAADDNSDEEKEGKTNGRKRRKRKRGRGKDRSGGVHVTGSFGGLN